MRSLLLCAGFVLASLDAKEMTATEKFGAENKAYREAWEMLLPQGNFKVQWGREGEDWLVRLKGQEGEKRGGLVTEEGFQAWEEEPKPSWQNSLRDEKLKPQAMPPPEHLFKKLKQISRRLIRVGGKLQKADSGWVWRVGPSSPEGTWLCIEKERDVPVRKVSYVRSSPEGQLQPEFFQKDYPKPGDDLRTRVPVVFGKEGQRIEIDEKLIENPYSITRAHWRTENKLWFEYIERGFGKYRLLELDASTGLTRIVAEENSQKFVHVFQKCGWWDLGDGQLLWRSEADGWSHLYAIDEQSGERKRLTEGEWVVREVVAIEGQEVTFQLSGFYPKQDPYYLHTARVNIETGEMTMLTHGDGTHRLDWSPDRSYYVDRYSRVDQPPIYELRKANDGSLIAELWRFDEEELALSLDWLPERFVTTDREGRYDIHGVIWKPKNFKPDQKYPVIENIYAGPHGAFVPKAWRRWHGFKSEVAAAGFVVVQIDGRGTNFRGREFQQFAYKNLKDSGFPDRIKWIEEAAASRPWMDLDRVGIYGGSAGGQSTLAGLLWHGDFYKAGVADCGCHDNRMDKIWWNEQWMDWPVDESYAANSNAEHVSRLRGDLFLTVGEVDTNVDPSSTYQVVDALIRADKDFEFLMVPNGNHGIGESPYLRRKRIEFFQRSLGQ